MANFMSNFMPGEWDFMNKTPDITPTDDASLQLILKRRLAQADLLKGMEAPQGQMVSGHYVAPSWTQYLANAVNKYQGRQQEQQAMQDYNQAQVSKAQKLGELMKGKTTFQTDEQGNQREVQTPYTNEELIGELSKIDSSYAPELFKSYIANQFKEDTPMVVGKNLISRTGKVLYQGQEEPKSNYANVQHDAATGKFYGLNLKTNQVEELPGASLTPKPAMTEYEKRSLALREGEIAKQDEGKFDNATLDMMADQALAGDKSVFTGLGRGKQGASNIAAIRQRMNQKMQDKGWSGSDIAAKNAEFMGNLAAERAIGTRGANVQLAGTGFNNIVPIAQAASDKVVRSGFLPFGKVEIMFNEQTNNPDLSAFAAANNGLVNTYARAISPTGIPTKADKDHAYQILSTAKNKAAYDAAVATLQKEIQAEIQSPKHVREMQRQEISGHGSSMPTQDAIAAELARRKQSQEGR